jgi:hypothetical protein
VDSNQDTVGVNTPHREWCPYVTVDGQTLYFAARRRDGYDDIYVCHLAGEGWSQPVMLPFCQLRVDERNPTVNATNDTLYFIAWAGNWDIFWSFRTGPEDTSWSPPERLPEPINSNGIEFSVWCTPDNQGLLFSSWRISANGEDIYECRRDPNTSTGWSDPVLLTGQLNTGDMESYPSMGSDTTELFFYGRYARIYRSVLTDTGWTRGDSLPDTVNRGTSETTPCVTPDGRRLYFSSRYGEPPPAGDIWYSDRRTGGSDPRHPALRQKQGLRIEVFPNPATDQFTIYTRGGIRRLTLFDLVGRTVGDRTLDGAPGTTFWRLPLVSGLPSGTYFLVGQSATARTVVPIQILR